MLKRFALVGNPNSGKTSLYNQLTAQQEQIGNWAGVTVSAKSRPLRSDKQTILVDLPGVFSLEPKSPDERVTSQALDKEHFDVIINVIDGANLERSLRLTLELFHLGKPVIIAINKADVLRKRRDEIDLLALEQILGVPVVALETGKPKSLSALLQKTASAAIPKPLEINPQEVLQKSLNRSFDPQAFQISDAIDRVLIHPVLGIVIFFFIMWGVFALSIEGVGAWLADIIQTRLLDGMLLQGVLWLLNQGLISELLGGFLQHVLLGGIGSVLSFIPLIMVLFFLLSLLEDSGYMARVAVLMEKYFRKIGLSGRSIIPMIVGSGCAVPGVMATRTIEQQGQRRLTALLTPFVPCSAKLPLIALISVAFFPDQSFVGPSVYLLSILIIILSGLLLKKAYGIVGESPFILELPQYKLPNLKIAFTRMVSQAKAFFYKAATVIFVSSAIIWVLHTFGPDLKQAADPSTSLLAYVGRLFSWILYPAGLDHWEIFSAMITGFVAKENVVSTLAVLYRAPSTEALASGGILSNVFTPATAYAFLLLNLFTPPCVAAMSAMGKELESRKLTMKSIGFQLAVGYLMAILTAQLGTFILTGKLLPGAHIALLIILGYVLAIIRLQRKKYE